MHRSPDSSPHQVTIAPATPGDVPTILAFITELAAYERLSHQVAATEADLHRWLFGPERVVEALVARSDGEPVGFALFFPNFSTFLGRPGIYLEDLYVRESARGRGVGRALLTRLAQIAVARGWGRVEWSVLDWNEPALRFYRSLGASVLDDWRICRLTGDALQQLGSTESAR
jgi:GNAT superfamily N-acetyltransferase